MNPASPDVRLLRSVLDDPFANTDLLKENLLALIDADFVFALEADRKIFELTRAFFGTHQHLPGLGTLRGLLAPDDDAVNRLERVLLVERALVRGDFSWELAQQIEARRARDLIGVAKTGVAIATSGADVDGSRLTGASDAAEYLANASAAIAANESEWPDPVPLHDANTAGLPACPVDALPRVLADFAHALATETQTDAAMCVVFGLGALAACTQRAYVVEVRKGWVEVLAMFAAAIAAPAERKSAVMRACLAGIYAWLEREAERHEARHREWRAALEHLRARAKRAKGPEHATLQLEIAEQEAAEPIEPRVLAGDVTQEELVKLAAPQGGAIAVMSAEGAGPFAIAGGRYSRGTSYEHLLAGHAGDPIFVDRVGRGSLRISRPSFAMCVACQLDALRTLAAIPGARGLGLLARFVYVFPTSRVGSRDVRSAPVDDAIASAWGRALQQILDASLSGGARTAIECAPAARERLLCFAQELEPRLGPDGDLKCVADWAGKLVGLVARISGLFAVLRCADALLLGELRIEDEDMRSAMALADWLTAHARAAFGAGIADPVTVAAGEILDWFVAHPEPVTKRELHRRLQGRPWLRNIADLDHGLGRLVDHGWVRVRTPPRMPGSRGRSRSATVELRPDAAALLGTTPLVVMPSVPPVVAAATQPIADDWQPAPKDFEFSDVLPQPEGVMQ